MTDSRLTSLPSRLAGGVWGHLIGDAMGVPYEFRSPAEVGPVIFGASGTHHQPPGTWSDDGALMLALLDSLLTAGFDTTDQAARALAWRDEHHYTPDGVVFDMGSTTDAALSAFARGVPAEDAGPAGLNDNGNGSLMRILPLALVGRDLPDAVLVERAHRASRVTHGHPLAQVCCARYALMAKGLLQGSSRHAALSESGTALRAQYRADPSAKAHLDALDFVEAYRERGGRGRVWDSLWSAWDAFAASDSYRATIEAAIRYGHDTDTTAAIAGGLAGIYWGLDGIPAEWLDLMRGHAVADPLVDRLVETDGWRTSRSHPIRIDWVDLAKVPRRLRGQLGMTFLPGKHDVGSAGRHWRTLATDIERLVAAHVDDLVLLVEDDELRALGVVGLPGSLARSGIRLIRYPIRDGAAPTDDDAFLRMLGSIEKLVQDGQRVVVACRGGLGRTGTVVACLLRDAGLDGPAAIELTRAARHGTVETREQAAFVERHRMP